MPSRRVPQGPPPLEIRDFTPEEIERGIAKLKKRIDEVKALEKDRIHCRDQRRNTVQDNISTTILEVFGPNSPEYRTHQYHKIWHGSMYVNMSDQYAQECFVAGIPQTITMLEGLISRLEERRADIHQYKATRAPGEIVSSVLHPRIHAACSDLYGDGHYSNAVLNGSIALVNCVKERSGRFDKDGSALMQEVFSPNNPFLAFNDLADQTDKDEQQGLMFLFAGAVLALRNPRAHKLLEDNPEEAAEYIGLLSLLAKRLDAARRVKTK